jgi:hypothetical protein
MKTRKKVKLALGRETLVALDARTLDAIMGGNDGSRPLPSMPSMCCGNTETKTWGGE